MPKSNNTINSNNNRNIREVATNKQKRTKLFKRKKSLKDEGKYHLRIEKKVRALC